MSTFLRELFKELYAAAVMISAVALLGLIGHVLQIW
jgi:hypothetical protein